MSLFASLPQAKEIDTFHILRQYIDDKCPEKVNLIVGVYRNEDGSAHMMKCVNEAKRLVNLRDDQRQQLPTLGHEHFRSAAAQLLLGDQLEKAGNHFLTVQTLGGSGAIRLGAEICAKFLDIDCVYIPLQTWGNHGLLAQDGGFKNVRTYRYLDSSGTGVDFEAMLADVTAAPKNSAIVLHACAHNPTGLDLNHDQWKILADVIQAKNHLPFFDSAFQGLCSADPDLDAFSVRYFVSRRIELLCAQNFSKNFGLYNERVGSLVVYSNDGDSLKRLEQQVEHIIHSNYRHPPLYGSQIVHQILTVSELRSLWVDELEHVVNRLKTIKEQLASKLESGLTLKSYEYIRKNTGMFCYLGLTRLQVEQLREVHHIYLLANGRLSFAGLNAKNIDHVVSSLLAVLKPI
ncbi:Aspartate aminotransferase, cytoplasmic [Halotydeus destructor]|nr:Aspartate aminotransferase, cytoplasmic [Halotydeus destructor]